jgi:hypothetical protein
MQNLHRLLLRAASFEHIQTSRERERNDGIWGAPHVSNLLVFESRAEGIRHGRLAGFDVP